MIAHGDGDLRFVAVLFHGENHMSIEVIAQDFSDLDKAVLDLFADCGSDFVLPSGVLHVHRTPSLVGGGNRCSECDYLAPGRTGLSFACSTSPSIFVPALMSAGNSHVFPVLG